jgi:hypothetical protein
LQKGPGLGRRAPGHAAALHEAAAGTSAAAGLDGLRLIVILPAQQRVQLIGDVVLTNFLGLPKRLVNQVA